MYDWRISAAAAASTTSRRRALAAGSASRRSAITVVSRSSCTSITAVDPRRLAAPPPRQAHGLGPPGPSDPSARAGARPRCARDLSASRVGDERGMVRGVGHGPELHLRAGWRACRTRPSTARPMRRAPRSTPSTAHDRALRLQATASTACLGPLRGAPAPRRPRRRSARPPPRRRPACPVPPPSARAASAAIAPAFDAALDQVLGHRHRDRGLGPVRRQRRRAPTCPSRAHRGRRARAGAARRWRGRRGAPRPRRRPPGPRACAPRRASCRLRSRVELVAQLLDLASSRSTRSATSSGVDLRAARRARSAGRSSSRMCASAPSPVTASMRRRFAPIEPSLTILIGPMNPSAWTWVPPHSSIECSPASRTRTRSPYLSPKNAIAPSALGVVLRRLVVAHRRVGDDLGVRQRLDALELLGRHRLEVAEVEPQPIGRHERPGLLHVRCPSTSRSAQCRTCVAVWLRRIRSRRSPSMRRRDLVALGDRASARPRTRARRDRAAPYCVSTHRATRVRRSVMIVPVSPTWPPDFGVERRAVEDDVDRVARRRHASADAARRRRSARAPCARRSRTPGGR